MGPKRGPVTVNYASMFNILSLFAAFSPIIWGLKTADVLPTTEPEYDKMRPPKENDVATVVLFHITVMGLYSIDESRMTYQADIFFAESWKDTRFEISEEKVDDGYGLFEMEMLDDLWRPDCYFKNAKSIRFQTMTVPNHYLWVFSNKKVIYMLKLSLTLQCAMNFIIYPHDSQECKIQLESLAYTTNDLIFKWDETIPLVVDKHIELPQLELIKSYTKDCTQIYSTGNFTCIEIIFVLKRRLGHFVLHTYIPTVLIVVMSWTSFWVKPDIAPARVSLGVTSILTLSTQHAKSAASLPPVSYLKAVDAFMMTCTIFVFMALVEYWLVTIVLQNQPQIPPQFPNLAWAAKNEEQRVAENELYDKIEKGKNECPKHSEKAIAKRNLRRALTVDKYSRYLFPGIFILLNVVYWIAFTVVFN